MKKSTKKPTSTTKKDYKNTTFDIEGHSIYLPKNFIDYLSLIFMHKTIEGLLIPIYASLDEHKVKDKDGHLILPEHLKERQDKILGLFSIHKIPNLPKIKTNMKQIDIITDTGSQNHKVAFYGTFAVKIPYIIKYLRSIEELQQQIPFLEYQTKMKKHLTDLLINAIKHEGHKNIEECLTWLNVSNYTIPELPKLKKKELEQYFEYGELMLGSATLYAKLRLFWLDLYNIRPTLTKYLDILTEDCSYEARRESIFKYLGNCRTGGITKDEQFTQPNYSKGNYLYEEAYKDYKDEQISTDQLYSKISSIVATDPKYENLKRNYWIYTNKKSIIKLLKELDKKYGIKRKKNLRAKNSTHS